MDSKDKKDDMAELLKKIRHRLYYNKKNTLEKTWGKVRFFIKKFLEVANLFPGNYPKI